MSKGVWIGTIGVLAVLAVGGGGVYVHQQSQDKELKTEQAKNQSMSKKLDSADQKSKANSKKEDTQKSESKADESSNTEASSSSASSSSASSVDNNKAVTLTDDQKQQVNEAFLDWADGRASVGNMAVTDYYFDHGAAGHGDWYANTPDGEIQVQDENNPGRDAFPIHAIGGVVFMTLQDGSTGRQDDIVDSIAGGYGQKADLTMPITKYILGDNGKVYELKIDDGQVGLTTGFGEYNDDGNAHGFNTDHDFAVSQDTAAQQELQKLISVYK